MLPELAKEDADYLVWLYHRRKVNADDVKAIYSQAASVIRNYVEPKWTLPGNEPVTFGPAAILYVHQILAHSHTDSFAARYCMHALLARYTYKVANQIG